MKKLPVVYRLNCIGGAIIIFLLVRSGLPPLFMKIAGNSPFIVVLAGYSVILFLSCFLPVVFIENMCDFHPDVLTGKPLKAENFAVTGASMCFFVLLAALNSYILKGLEEIGIHFPAQTLQPAKGLRLVLYFVYIAVLPAFCEEFFVRGTVLGLVRDQGDRFAILFSAIVFTLMHTTVESFLPVFARGIVLGCVYVYTGNIYASVLLHFVNNAYSFFMMYFSRNYSEINDLGLSAFLLFLVFAAGIAGTIAVIKKKINILSPLLHSGEGRLKLILKSPVLILGLIMCLAAGLTQAFSALTEGI